MKSTAKKRSNKQTAARMSLCRVRQKLAEQTYICGALEWHPDCCPCGALEWHPDCCPCDSQPSVEPLSCRVWETTTEDDPGAKCECTKLQR